MTTDMVTVDREVNRFSRRLAMTDGIEVPKRVIDLLLELGTRTPEGVALITGYRLATPHLAPELGPATIELRGSGWMRLTAVPSGITTDE